MPTTQGRETAARQRQAADRPLIFSAPLVRAIMAGRKSMTRRVLKPQPYPFECQGKPYWNASGCVGGRICISDAHLLDLHRWRAGQRLWVKEACGRRPASFLGIEATNGVESAFYRADHEDVLNEREFNLCPWWEGPTLSPIFMPRWASRLTLIVESVRVERLADICREDAIAEGIQRIGGGVLRWENWSGAEGQSAMSPEGAYALLWDSLHGKGAFEASPWVAAISFRVIPQNIDRLSDPLPTGADAGEGRHALAPSASSNPTAAQEH